MKAFQLTQFRVFKIFGTECKQGFVSNCPQNCCFLFVDVKIEAFTCTVLGVPLVPLCVDFEKNIFGVLQIFPGRMSLFSTILKSCRAQTWCISLRHFCTWCVLKNVICCEISIFRGFYHKKIFIAARMAAVLRRIKRLWIKYEISQIPDSTTKKIRRFQQKWPTPQKSRCFWKYV